MSPQISLGGAQKCLSLTANHMLSEYHLSIMSLLLQAEEIRPWSGPWVCLSFRVAIHPSSPSPLLLPLYKDLVYAMYYSSHHNWVPVCEKGLLNIKLSWQWLLSWQKQSLSGMYIYVNIRLMSFVEGWEASGVTVCLLFLIHYLPN